MVEVIPSGDLVSRTFDSPEKWNAIEEKFVDDRMFLFKSENAYAESVVWRRYVPTMAEVHALGCARQAEKRLDPAKKGWTYEGASTAIVGDIRAIGTSYGDSVDVLHDPSDGQGIHHAHIQLQLVEDAPKLKQRRSDLREFVRLLFLAIEQHKCPSDPIL